MRVLPLFSPAFGLLFVLWGCGVTRVSVDACTRAHGDVRTCLSTYTHLTPCAHVNCTDNRMIEQGHMGLTGNDVRNKVQKALFDSLTVHQALAVAGRVVAALLFVRCCLRLLQHDTAAP